MDNEEIIEIVEHNDSDFKKYKELVNKFYKMNEKREIIFQDDIVKPFIKDISPNLYVDNCSKTTTSSNHDYHQYCGLYIDEKGKEKAASPDLVIAKNWNWLNKENDVEYCAVVEVKSPCLEQAIYRKNFQKYDNLLKDELKLHLSATKNDKVILTDVLKWEFYKKDSGLVPIRTFELYNLHHGGKWEWKKGEKITVEDEVIYEIFEKGIERESYIKEFEELKRYLIEFLENKSKD